ncbi:MAG TPA: bile acid:sodium symporter [Gemmataceae bacterium]|nr:bile acid:sodium symporter [Gemmataceae bacterium]
MRALLSRQWFSIILLGAACLAFLRPAWLRPVTVCLEPGVVVAVALFVMAWSLESRSLLTALVRPWPALWAALLSYGLVPVLGLLAGLLIPQADLRVGLLIITSVPCTLASAVLWTRLARGNEATALLVVLLTTAISWLATTAWLTFGTGLAAAVKPASMMQSLLLVLVVPVGLGQLSRSVPLLARAATRLKSALGILSRLLVLCIVLKAIVDVSDRLGGDAGALTLWPLMITLLLCLGVHLAALFFGLHSSRLLRFERANQIAVAFACSQKTLPVALSLFDTYFVGSFPLAVVPLVFYHVGQLLLDTVIAERLLTSPAQSPTLNNRKETS